MFCYQRSSYKDHNYASSVAQHNVPLGSKWVFMFSCCYGIMYPCMMTYTNVIMFIILLDIVVIPMTVILQLGHDASPTSLSENVFSVESMLEYRWIVTSLFRDSSYWHSFITLIVVYPKFGSMLELSLNNCYSHYQYSVHQCTLQFSITCNEKRN